jgi:putative Holliday junction resolvase
MADPPPRRTLGVDLGARFVGLSLHTDPEVPARALQPLDRKRVGLLAGLQAVLAREDVGAVVLGLPLRMDGGECQASREARRVAHALGEATGLPVTLWDERLTTVQAVRFRQARGVKGREGLDSEAATILLQACMDALRGPENTP